VAAGAEKNAAVASVAAGGESDMADTNMAAANMAATNMAATNMADANMAAIGEKNMADTDMAATNMVTPIGGATMAAEPNMATESKMAAGPRPFLCPLCGRGFATGAGLRRHQRRHGPAPNAPA
ncbi:ZN628 protein, partial [Mystacornis crossleyi]|nr:ZN628 protein [Mystacornis crossleyi]